MKPSSHSSDGVTDLAMTLPIFVLYHVGVVFLPIRNAADWVTSQLVSLVHFDRLAYVALTLAIGGAYVGWVVLVGKGSRFAWRNFLWLGCEGVTYALAMRVVASAVVGRLPLGFGSEGLLGGLVMSLGAGFYEEIAFRVGLFGWGNRLLLRLGQFGGRTKRALVTGGWAVASAAVFSGWHHFGVLGDPFELRVFVFRWICGVLFVGIYRWRGFAPVVWTHVLYDVWVIVL